MLRGWCGSISCTEDCADCEIYENDIEILDEIMEEI